MDYDSIHGPGISNFSSPIAHRMPTISAAQALEDLKSSPTRCISTGLSLLDHALQNSEPQLPETEPFYGGVSRGEVTEVYGPPGVGKTALGMQLAASALHAGEGVIWVDASHSVPGTRLSQILATFHPIASQSSTEPRSTTDLLDNLTHFSTPTLAHLVALFSRTSQTHPAPNTSLIIIDSFSSLITTAFSRTVDATATPKRSGAPNPSARKFPILQYLTNTLQKLAATRNIAVVVFSQCVTKMRPGCGAVLVPAVSTTAWEQGLGCRVALFRDWGWNNEDGQAVNNVRLVQVIKAEGTAVPDGRQKVVGFSIDEDGFNLLDLPSTTFFDPSRPQLPPARNLPSTPILPQKRKISATDLEVPDSEGEDDEDYGWAEEDEGTVPVMPPQWQGSEDILIPPPGELEVEDAEEEPENEAGGEKQLRDEIDDSEDELAL
ncbi:DNA repair protein rhp55 [Lachnellula cervina]|uniref:DNA repair protein RAD51 homolog 3 n=1 Tax=Lachnellula cervina TaxID=1316786 RepID=A0A7D8YVF2_9HELO|nr:DNA repair protein rhp55 [Lachnellula cervina]